MTMTPIAHAAEIAKAAAAGDAARAKQLAAELGVPGAATRDPATLVRSLITVIEDRGEIVPKSVDQLAASRDLTMADLARVLAAGDTARSRVPIWLPVSLGVLTFAAMGLAVWVGRGSLGFIDPAPDCKPPAGAASAGVAAIRFDDACRILSWQTESNATWILERDADGTPTLATRSAAQSIRVLELAPDGTVSGTRGRVAPAELATLTSELAPMLR